MAMKLPMPPTQAPRRGLPRTSGSLSTAALRILARPLGDSASAAISGTTFERSRMPPLESMIPGFSRPRGPKRTSFMDSPRAEGGESHQGAGSCVGEVSVCGRPATSANILKAPDKTDLFRMTFVLTCLPPSTYIDIWNMGKHYARLAIARPLHRLTAVKVARTRAPGMYADGGS